MPTIIDRANNSMNQASGAISSDLFRGIVVDNKDPAKLCRLKVQIPSITGVTMPPDGLPWAYPCVPTAGPGYGMCIVPEVGSTVWVLFESGDKSKPVWIGCSFGGSTDEGMRYMTSEGSDTFRLSKGNWSWKIKEVDTPYEYVADDGNTKVLYHSPKGASILIHERDEHEGISIIDRLGQVIRMSCPVRVEYNEDNQSVRYSGDVENDDITDKVNPGNPGVGYILLQTNSGSKEISNSALKIEKLRSQLVNGEMAYDAREKVSVITDYDGEVELRVEKDDEQKKTEKNIKLTVLEVDENDIVTNTSVAKIKEDEILLETGNDTKYSRITMHKEGRIVIDAAGTSIEMSNGTIHVKGNVVIDGTLTHG